MRNPTKDETSEEKLARITYRLMRRVIVQEHKNRKAIKARVARMINRNLRQANMRLEQ